MSNKLYVDDMLVAEVPDSITTIPASAINIVADELWPGTVKYQSTVSSTEYLPWKQLLHRTNCCNCGAPLPRHGKCLYCDTENDRNVKNEPFESLHTEMDTTAKNTVVTCLRDKLNPYMQSVEYRDVQGRLHRKVVDLRE